MNNKAKSPLPPRMAAATVCVMALFAANATAAEIPQHGGILTFVHASKPPSTGDALDNPIVNMNCGTDFARQRRLTRQYEQRILDGQAHMLVVLWLYRISPHRCVVRGWNVGPSHHMNQDLSTAWLMQ